MLGGSETGSNGKYGSLAQIGTDDRALLNEEHSGGDRSIHGQADPLVRGDRVEVLDRRYCPWSCSELCRFFEPVSASSKPNDSGPCPFACLVSPIFGSLPVHHHVAHVGTSRPISKVQCRSFSICRLFPHLGPIMPVSSLPVSARMFDSLWLLTRPDFRYVGSWLPRTSLPIPFWLVVAHRRGVVLGSSKLVSSSFI